MFSLVYASKAAEAVTLETARAIWETASRENQTLGISGVLFFNAHYFIQCIEGDREVVNKLYNKISRDRRHLNPVILSYGPIPVRNFAAWAMGLFTSKQVNRVVLLKYGLPDEFVPSALDGESCLAFLKEAFELIPTSVAAGA